ncbi:MAG TPA: hypothetical protein VF773_17150 [Verrucomicrobiae bacterium]
MATRIIGPVPEHQATAVLKQLKNAFESAGIIVTEEIAADD